MAYPNPKGAMFRKQFLNRGGGAARKRAGEDGGEAVKGAVRRGEGGEGSPQEASKAGQPAGYC